MKRRMFFLCLLLGFLGWFPGLVPGRLPAQVSSNRQSLGQARYSLPRRDRFFAFWGWNRDVYSTSNIHFQGDGYNFVLRHVVAHDKPEPLGFDPYFHPTKFTIPQTNARIGYFFNRDWSISLALDHMKYVMEQDQSVSISGHIGTGSAYDGNYLHDFVHTDRNFLTFEHTDGLNYIAAELRHHDPIWRYRYGRLFSLELESFYGFGAGILLPKTNCKLLGTDRHDDFHLSGWGGHVITGLGLTLCRHFVIQGELKGGWLDMPSIRTTNSRSDHADQRFWFGELAVMVGGSFDFNRRLRRK